MPSTRTKTPSSTPTTILLGAEEFDAPGLSGECSAGATAGDPLPLPAALPCALSPQLIEEALDQARLRRTVSELPVGQRRELIEAVLEQLADGCEELPEELNDRVLDRMLGGLIAGRRGEREILGSDGVLGELSRRLIERALAEELNEHLGYPAGHAPAGGAGNSRNGGTPKTVLTDHGPVAIRTPRDRKSRFEPRLVGKHQRRLAGLDEKIVALYAGGMSTREIEDYITGLYGPGVSRETVSRASAGVLE
ncbi:MAG: transposase, partial [Solirubrobacteraceae bacterium]